jgi:hypothetical protein
MRLEEHEAAGIQVLAQKEGKDLLLAMLCPLRETSTRMRYLKLRGHWRKNIRFWMGRRFFERGVNVSVQLHSALRYIGQGNIPDVLAPTAKQTLRFQRRLLTLITEISCDSAPLHACCFGHAIFTRFRGGRSLNSIVY